MNTHYLFIATVEISGESRMLLHNFQAPSEDVAWENVDRYLTAKGVSTIEVSALESFPSEKAVAECIVKTMRQLAEAGFAPKRLNPTFDQFPWQQAAN